MDSLHAPEMTVEAPKKGTAALEELFYCKQSSGTFAKVIDYLVGGAKIILVGGDRSVLIPAALDSPRHITKHESKSARAIEICNPESLTGQNLIIL